MSRIFLFEIIGECPDRPTGCGCNKCTNGKSIFEENCMLLKIDTGIIEKQEVGHFFITNCEGFFILEK